MVSEERVIWIELIVSVFILTAILSYLGAHSDTRSIWNSAVTALFGWVIADAVAGLSEGSHEGKVWLFGRWELPFPHAITFAYFFYPISIVLALFYGDVVTAMFLQGLKWLQQTSLLSLILQLMSQPSLVPPEKSYVPIVSFILSIMLLHAFRSTTKTEQQTQNPEEKENS